MVPSSTGRIGVPLPRARVRRGVLAAARALAADGFFDALEGMMTTDAFPKFAVERLRLDGRPVTIAGMAKGAGMIAPHMATLLVYVLTDAAVSRPALRRVLAAALPQSFNAIVVDGDMSTNDTVLLLANGVGRQPAADRALARDSRAFAAAATRLMRAPGAHGREGRRGRDQGHRHRRARRAQRARRRRAWPTPSRARRSARRPSTAAIRTPAASSARPATAARVFDPGKLDVYLDDVQIVRRGVEVVGRVERRASRVAAEPEFTLTLDLHAGTGDGACAWPAI